MSSDIQILKVRGITLHIQLIAVILTGHLQGVADPTEEAYLSSICSMCRKLLWSITSADKILRSQPRPR